jgi:tetratricopeptide (TPR) repeat protein
LELGFTVMILTGVHSHNGDRLKVLAGYLEMKKLASLITNKQFGAMINKVLSAKLAAALDQIDRANEEYRQAMQAIEKTVGKHHYLYAAFDLEYGHFLFNAGKYAEAEEKFLNLETSYRSALGGDGLRLADIYYHISRSISRGSLKDTSPGSEPQRYQELAAKAVRYARTAYDQAKKSDAEPAQMAVIEVYLCHTLIHYEPHPDYAEIEAIARKAWDSRGRLCVVGGNMHTHPLCYLLVALARQDKIEDLESVFLDLLARKPDPKWNGNASYALPEAAAKLARAGKTKTAVLMLEHAATTTDFDLNSVHTDADFAELRKSTDYQELLKKIKAPR